MDTNNLSSEYNKFIYALGMICFLNILSSEFKIDNIESRLNIELTEMVSDCNDFSSSKNLVL